MDAATPPPAAVELIALTKRYAATGPAAVDQINLRIESGSCCCLLDRSGCGKRTTLRMVAGHESVSNSDVLLNNRNITNLPAATRGTAMMFQSFALFPHLSALDNIAFSLKMKGVAKSRPSRPTSFPASTWLGATCRQSFRCCAETAHSPRSSGAKWLPSGRTWLLHCRSVHRFLKWPLATDSCCSSSEPFFADRTAGMLARQALQVSVDKPASRGNSGRLRLRPTACTGPGWQRRFQTDTLATEATTPHAKKWLPVAVASLSSTSQGTKTSRFLSKPDTPCSFAPYMSSAPCKPFVSPTTAARALPCAARSRCSVVGPTQMPRSATERENAG